MTCQNYEVKSQLLFDLYFNMCSQKTLATTFKIFAGAPGCYQVDSNTKYTHK